MVIHEIEEVLKRTFKEIGYSGDIHLEYPTHGESDIASTYAFHEAKKRKVAPKEIAQDIASKIKDPLIKSVEASDSGYINIILSDKCIEDTIIRIQKAGDSWGNNEILKDKKISVEFTDPNPLKEIHIGHVMSNTIGESLARIFEACGASVARANYQGDVGLHIAKAVWGLKHNGYDGSIPKQIGESYALGAEKYETDEKIKEEIQDINVALYSKSSKELNELYETAKDTSLESFEVIYERLGTKFDIYFFESVMAPIGEKVVRDSDDVFEESEGAIVFRGEKYGLHTRVFINNKGIPTYEAKELGLAIEKERVMKPDESYIVTASEIKEYSKVVFKALSLIKPKIAEKTEAIFHGVLQLATGKMSSREGTIVKAETLLDLVHEAIKQKAKEEIKDIDAIAVGAIKYSILNQHREKNSVFDESKATSFQGDSGPYLHYTLVRAKALLKKGSVGSTPYIDTDVARYLHRFERVIEQAYKEKAPHYIAQYLTSVCGLFNSWYTKEPILGQSDTDSRLATVSAVAITIERGLWLLGIKSIDQM